MGGLHPSTRRPGAEFRQRGRTPLATGSAVPTRSIPIFQSAQAGYEMVGSDLDGYYRGFDDKHVGSQIPFRRTCSRDGLRSPRAPRVTRGVTGGHWRARRTRLGARREDFDPSAARTAGSQAPMTEPTPDRSLPPPRTGATPKRGPALVGFGRGAAPGQGSIVAALLTRPAKYGLIVAAIGAVLVAVGLTRGHVDSGPALLVIGVGWVACERIPLDRPRARLMGIAASMAIAIVIETALRWLALLGR